MSIKIKLYKQLLFPFLSLIISCNTEPNDSNIQLSLMDSYNLNIYEPSGLTYNKNNNELFLVTDKPYSKIFSIDFFGNIIDSLNFDGNDLEAITYNYQDSTFWLSEESLIQIVKIYHNGNEIDRWDIDFLPFNFGEIRIEGLCINYEDNSLYMLNEKNPGALIELDINSLSLKNIYYLNFARDYSAIDFIENKSVFVILSDLDKSIYLWSENDGLIYSKDIFYQKAEGVAVVADKLFIVSEQENKLYEYDIN